MSVYKYVLIIVIISFGVIGLYIYYLTDYLPDRQLSEIKRRFEAIPGVQVLKITGLKDIGIKFVRAVIDVKSGMVQNRVDS